MILRGGFEVLGQVVDPFAENRHLHFRRAGVAFVGSIRTDQFRFAILRQSHVRWSSTYAPDAHPAAPGRRIAENLVSRARSTCYIRTTDGCKSPRGVGSAIATRRPAASSSLTYRTGAPGAPEPPSAACGKAPAHAAGPMSRPWATAETPSGVSRTASSPGSKRSMDTP